MCYMIKTAILLRADTSTCLRPWLSNIKIMTVNLVEAIYNVSLITDGQNSGNLKIINKISKVKAPQF